MKIYIVEQNSKAVPHDGWDMQWFRDELDAAHFCAVLNREHEDREFFEWVYRAEELR